MAIVLRWPDMAPGDIRSMGLGKWKAHLEIESPEAITEESWTFGPVPGSDEPLGVVTLGFHGYDAAKDRTSVLVSAVSAGEVRCTCRVVTNAGQIAFRSADLFIVQR